MENEAKEKSDYESLLEGVAFEIRNQLSTLHGYTELIQEKVESSHCAAGLVADLRAQLDHMMKFSKALDDRVLEEHRRRIS